MTLYLYRLQATRPAMLGSGPTPEEAVVLDQHQAYLEDLKARDVILLAGRTQTTDYSTFALVLFRAESEGEARRVVSDDPAVVARLMRAELYPYRVNLIGDLSHLT